MSQLEAKVPDIGTDEAVEVVELSVSVGDLVEVDDPILVLETDKATFEVPAEIAGNIAALNVKVGDKVSQGDTIALIESVADAVADATSEPTNESQASEGEVQAEEPAAPQATMPAAENESVTEAQTIVISVPDTGSDSPVEVVEVLVSEGENVEEEVSIVALESDKATFEVPSPQAGKITKVLLKVGDKVNTGDSVAELLTAATDSPISNIPEVPAVPSQPIDPAESDQSVTEKAVPAREELETHEENTSVHAGPSVRKLARELGVRLGEVKGSGPKSRILKDDIHAFVKQRLSAPSSAISSAGSQSATLSAPPLPDFSSFGEIEKHAMSRIHLATAKNMHVSWSHIPHVTQFDEADITDLEAFRKSHKGDAEKRGTKLTPMAFILKACAYALEQLPQFNVSLDLANQQVIQKHYIHIGVAVDTPDGLVVPVIRDVNHKGIWELASDVIELAAKARDKKLKPADMQGGCFTISSLGGIGGTAFTPIVNLPEVAILGISKSETKPVYNGQDFVPRLMMPLSLSYDHRAVNGADAARFTSLLGACLGDIRRLLL